jgi:hypothetical protein
MTNPSFPPVTGSYPVFPFGLTLTLVKRTPSGNFDEYGNVIYDERKVQVSNCAFQSQTSSENLEFADQLLVTNVVFMPYGTDVQSVDAIEVFGDRYEVVGDPNSYISPFSGHTGPIRVNLSKIEGVAMLCLDQMLGSLRITRVSARC